MVDTVSGTGSLGFVNGSPTFFGGQSKIDTQALIDALVAAKRLPAVRIETSVTENEAKIAALNDLKTRLEDFRTALNGLRSPPGFLGVEDNIFEQKGAFLTASADFDPNGVMAVTTEPGAVDGTYEVEVVALAKAEKYLAYTDTGTGFAAGGTISIGLGTSPSGTPLETAEGYAVKDIAIAAGESVASVRDKINAVSSETGVTASVISTASGDKLILNGRDPAFGIYVNDPSAVLNSHSDPANILQAAQQAHIKVDGFDVYANTNEVTDAVEGVTFSLFRAQATGETVTARIGTDLAAVKQTIVDFVNAYNSFRDFIAEQQVVSADGEVGESAALFGSNTVRTAMSEVSQELIRAVGGVSGMRSLAELGIELDSSNRLTVDDATLDEALLTKLDQVRDVFEFRFASSSNDLQVLRHTKDIDVTDFTITVNSMAADGSGISVTGISADGTAIADGNYFTVEGDTLVGKAGSPFDGLKLVYTGAVPSGGITVSMSQGIGDRLYNAADSMLATDGLVPNDIDSLEDRNDALNTEIADIERRAEEYRAFLIEKFAKLEEALALSNAILDQVKATAGAMNGSSS